MKPLYLSIVAATVALSAAAQDTGDKFTIKPTGRILADGAIYLPGNEKDGFVSGVAIPDVRVGVKAGYGNWKAKIDLGFAYAKVNMKDIYVEYDFNESNLLRGGYFVQQFGLNSVTSSSMKETEEEATSNEFFNANPRSLGIMYQFQKGRYFAAASAFVEGEAIKRNASEMGKQGFGFQTRLVWRPFHEAGKFAHIGCSFNYATPTYSTKEGENHSSYHFSSNFPSRVSKVCLLDADITQAKDQFKMSPELLLGKGRVALEAQYYYMNIWRKSGFGNYHAQGAYGILRGILKGSDYAYSDSECGIATPAPGSLEMAVMYNYTNANDTSAGIFGGISHDASCTFNYYINKYMIARLRYSYTTVRDRALSPSDRHVNIIQARFQVIF